ncbi:uncharacterized protein F4812DRAFT_470911 [Daldinia caldariorum]|uniref:uncharacterized protein n=1 Tax=Daldinia caldariorum TaxID=326644 RepID=UPI002008A5EB|nr:uncharacterized protein F4812DRAFT_470911 [Daldinia caldariorum]KAI1468284.1 hypothetical protein F4812DRAFT_470911 [Daldinia caldariorum]
MSRLSFRRAFDPDYSSQDDVGYTYGEYDDIPDMRTIRRNVRHSMPRCCNDCLRVRSETLDAVLEEFDYTLSELIRLGEQIEDDDYPDLEDIHALNRAMFNTVGRHNEFDLRWSVVAPLTLANTAPTNMLSHQQFYEAYPPQPEASSSRPYQQPAPPAQSPFFPVPSTAVGPSVPSSTSAAITANPTRRTTRGSRGRRRRNRRPQAASQTSSYNAPLPAPQVPPQTAPRNAPQPSPSPFFMPPQPVLGQVQPAGNQPNRATGVQNVASPTPQTLPQQPQVPQTPVLPSPASIPVVKRPLAWPSFAPKPLGPSKPPQAQLARQATSSKRGTATSGEDTETFPGYELYVVRLPAPELDWDECFGTQEDVAAAVAEIYTNKVQPIIRSADSGVPSGKEVVLGLRSEEDWKNQCALYALNKAFNMMLAYCEALARQGENVRYGEHQAEQCASMPGDKIHDDSARSLAIIRSYMEFQYGR